MRTETKVTKIYKFEELTDESKESAVMNLWDINIRHEWWDGVDSDLAELGCKLTDFDIDRGSFCHIDFSQIYISEVAEKITKEHGPGCDTTKLAKQYLEEYQKLLKTTEDSEEEPDLSDINKEFIDSLQEEYLAILRREYEYLTSEESIIEAIEANDYEFTVDGKLY